MTIKWVKIDPLVMNGEPFCGGSRLTVRNLLEMRRNGLTPSSMLANHPELRWVGIAEVFRFAGENRARYPEFFAPDGSLAGPGFSPPEAASLPEHLRRLSGIVTTGATPPGAPGDAGANAMAGATLRTAGTPDPTAGTAGARPTIGADPPGTS